SIRSPPFVAGEAIVRDVQQRILKRRFACMSLALAAFLAAGTGAAAQQEQPAHEVRLEPVLVTSTRTDLSHGEPTASATVLDRDAVEQSANIPVDDILRTIPGFSTFRQSSSLVLGPDEDPEAQGVTLRGVGPTGASRALVMVDGLPLIDAFG